MGFDVWMCLACNPDRRLASRVRGTFDGVRRYGPPPLLPYGPFRPDWQIFVSTLARRPEVRQPWLRAIYDRVKDHPYADPF